MSRATAVGRVRCCGASLPLYFLLLVADRAVGARRLARRCCRSRSALVLLAVTRALARLAASSCRQPRLLGLTALAGLLIYVNWQVFVYRHPHRAGRRDQPRLLHQPDHHGARCGVFVLHERLRAAAVGRRSASRPSPSLVIVVGYGEVPVDRARRSRASFGVYGLIKKKVGPAVDAVSGLTLESFVARRRSRVVQLVLVALTPAGLTMGAEGAWARGAAAPSPASPRPCRCSSSPPAHTARRSHGRSA